MVGDVEQRILVRAPHRVEPFRRDAIAEQFVVADAGKQQGLGRGRRGGRRWNDSDLDPLRQFDELRRAGHRMPFDLAPLGPRIGGVVVPDIADKQARRRPVHDQSDIVIDAHRPEIRVAGPIEPMETQTRIRQVQLQIKRRRLDRFLLRPIEPGEAGGEGIGDAEVHVLGSDTDYSLSSVR
jgi:hypothetical protein